MCVYLRKYVLLCAWYACKFVCYVYRCVGVSACVYVGICKYVCMHVCSVYNSVCIHVYVYMYIYVLCLFACMHEYVYMHVQVYMSMYKLWVYGCMLRLCRLIRAIQIGNRRTRPDPDLCPL